MQNSRRRIWLDAQKLKWSSFDELNAWLGQRCRDYWSELRHTEFTQFTVMEMLEQERLEMMPMPTPFDGYVEKSAKVSSTCLVSVERNRYSVPCEWANHRVSTRLYPTQVCVVAGDAVVASHERAADRGHTRYDWHPSHSEAPREGEIRYGLRPSLLSPSRNESIRETEVRGQPKPGIQYTYPQLPIQKAATRPGSILDRQGGSIFNRREHSGLSVRAELDNADYPKGVAVSDKEFEAINIERNDFRGDWNYCIRPG